MKYYLILLLSLLLFLPGFSQDQLNQMNYGYFDKNDLSFIPIGEAANAYSYAGNPKTSLWADDKINSVSFVHRMVFEYNTGDATGRIAYDVSLQMGASGSWTSNTQVYDPVINPNAWQHRSSRYPQGAIYNPFGNEDPENAYFTYFSPVFTYDNDFYGDYAFGINQLSETNPPNPSRNYTDDIDSIYRCVPSAFTITQDGFSWAADKNFDIINQEYQESLILNKGAFNDSLEDFEYEECLLPFLSENDTITDLKIAFAPDGQTGYICALAQLGDESLPFTHFHPVLLKTEDGGESWSEPIHCQLGGENGLEEVKEFIPDSVLPGSVSNRDSLFFSMEYHLDMVVDFEGNAHITGLIALADSLQQWYPSYQLMGTFHVIFNNESESWDARHLYSNHTFEGVFDSQFSQYNNPHISSDVDGQFLFLSWIDSDVEGLENNIMPNFYSITYATEDDAYSEINNLTEFTQAMWHAYFAGQSHYVFRDTLPGVGVVFNIPVVYQELSDDLDPLEPVQYWYIEGFKFIIPDISVEENQTATFKLTNAYPNPFSEKVKIKLNVSDSENLEIEVFNSTGQLVKSIPIGRLPKGKHQIEINTSGLTRDVYFLRLKSGKKCEGLKMIKL